MKQPTKQELRNRVNELVTELTIARSNEAQAKERLDSVSNELVVAHKRILTLEDIIVGLREELRDVG